MNGIKADPDVKMDPDALTPSGGGGFMDDDFYEDTGEMIVDRSGADKDVWVTRIPDWLYEAVSKWDDIADGNDSDQIQIGEVVAFATTSGIDKAKQMRVFLNDRWRQKSNLPSAFQLEPASVSDTLLGNTYVFTEKDLPGFKGQGYGYGRGGHQGSFGGVQDPKARIQKRTKYKKAIPKQTALIGHATRQYTANPLDTKEYQDFSAARIKQAIQGSHLTTIITKDTDVSDVNNSITLNNRFKNFIKPTTKNKAQQNKAARMARSDLIDVLHSLFDEYQYWPMKAIKQRTKQPEQYLKEVLGDIALLVKSGPFASNWKRQAVFENQRDISKQAEAAAPEGPGDGESEGEDEMEDVV
ncbi:transcription initiation factor IIF [Pyrenophora seminiperda CCB06]|uniref:Transcription initiation factor IIF subunit beta n=1 Tax=Pyrenophora seminiperda CCB06 TaxID=1302712 RepID=A0A3M7LWT7_9PLEO|nr:transcription initiation factor IIF [Pyrenophora seminiperda CCB06]